MGLFGFGKKKNEVATETCNCGGGCESGCACEQEKAESTSGVIVLGGGCDKCNQLEAEAKKALAQLDMDTNVGHITDFGVIATYGVMSTPALVVDGKVIVMGKVAKSSEIMKLIKDIRK